MRSAAGARAAGLCELSCGVLKPPARSRSRIPAGSTDCALTHGCLSPQPHAPPEDREEDRGPGPGQYGTKVAFGTQAQSNRTTAAKFSFGTARRDAYSRQFLNPDLQKHMSNPATAGVDFIAPTGVGKMIESKKATAPSFSFGTAPRQQYLRSFISKGMQSRMPGRNTTNVDFIDADSSLGKKSNSKKASSASFSFGTQPRGAYERQYLSKGHQATMVRDTTATVDFIDKRSSFGGMQESRKGTAPSFGFGTSERGHRVRSHAATASPSAVAHTSAGRHRQARIAPLKDLSPRA